jgi:hypothetical protein
LPWPLFASQLPHGSVQIDKRIGKKKMTDKHTLYKTFSESDMKNFEPALKIGLLATVTPEGLPHITLLSSMMAASPTQLVWGQFTEGMSFNFVRNNPKASFLIMSLQKELWRGRILFTHTDRSGKDYEKFNNIPMFRYNAYFGIHTVYYADLIDQTGKGALPMGSIIFSSIKTLLAKNLAGGKSQKVILNIWTQRLLDKIGNLKFLAYIQENGFPVIIPVIQAMTLDSERVLFSTSVYKNELKAIPSGSPAAIFGMSLDMTDVLVRGTYEGIQNLGGVTCAGVRINYVYSPMPPKPQQIYPEVKIETIRDF